MPVSATAWIDELKSADGVARLFSERGAQIVVLVLLLALGIDSALILTRLLGAGSSTAAVVVPPVAPPNRNVNPTLQLANIVDAHLFGASAAPQNSADAPQTTAQLILAGVIADKDPTVGQAIIGENAASAKLYEVGASLPGGAKLHEVYGDRVIIERNGGLESLMLPRTAGGSGAIIAAPTPQRAPVRDNSTLLAGLVRVQPSFSQGKLSGYHIFPGGKNGNAAFTQLGLRAGDLITAVNGSNLDDPARALEVLQTLSSSSSATVTVLRNGQPQEVSLNLATLPTSDSGGGDVAPAEPPQGVPRGRFPPPTGTPPSANGADGQNDGVER